MHDYLAGIFSTMEKLERENPENFGITARYHAKLRDFMSSGQDKEIYSEILIFDNATREFKMVLTLNPDKLSFDVKFEIVNPSESTKYN